jgi:hypothetical protein
MLTVTASTDRIRERSRAARPAAARFNTPTLRLDERSVASLLQQRAGNHAMQRLLAAPRAGGLLQRLAHTVYGPNGARATVAHADLGTGTAATVDEAHVRGHRGNAHPYHHERGHLIAKQLGGDGADPRNLVGLSDGTNAPLMADMEGLAADIVRAAGPGASVVVDTTVDFTKTHYCGPPVAPYEAGMVGAISVVLKHQDGTELFKSVYPNGVVKKHPAAGCC